MPKPGFNLNWFLPALRTARPGRTDLGRDTRLRRLLRGWLPSALFSDRRTKQRGWIRRGLRVLGISWLSSPLRRLVQASCLLAFLWLFFYVCWPYDAQPEAEGRVSSGWALVEIGQSDGTLLFEHAEVPEWIRAGLTVHLAFGGAGEVQTRGASESGAAMRVVQVTASRAALRPDGALTERQIDRLLAGGDWALHEKAPDAWPSHYARRLADKEVVPAELFLALDPLVSISTAVAARQWVWSLIYAAAILAVCLLVPRAFCGYVCPLGTLIDLFDWGLGRHIRRFRVSGDGWWVHLKYYLLAATLLCALGGVLISGYVAAIPVITRGMLFVGEPLQHGLMRGWHQVPPIQPGQLLSILLFFAVLGLGLLRPRFWCKYVCPSGAVFSLGNLFRLSERKVESSCIHCNKCIEVCPFDAIKPDFTTRVTDCTQCQTCGGVCPTHAIKFVERWNTVQLKVKGDPPTHETALGRRGFLSLAAGTAAAFAGTVGVVAATRAWGANLTDPAAVRPVRPPGSVPEREFLQMCIRCGECFKACPNNVLQPEGWEQGWEGLWTPLVRADWAGCESSCNACGQVCPTGAIRALPLAEKIVARMGLAVVDQDTCLPLAGREACQLCVDECNAAGYEAIEFTYVHTQLDAAGNPVAGSGFLAPVVLADKCVGCGLCQTRCYGINVKEKRLLAESAIVVEAGEGKEDRLLNGSYIELRQQEAARRRSRRATDEPAGEFFVPEADEPAAVDGDRSFKPPTDSGAAGLGQDDPFGIGN